MIKKAIISGILGLATFAAPVLAAPATKYTFNDVVIDGVVREIEASVRSGKNPYSTCSYYTDNYVTYEGVYAEAAVAGSDATAVLNFCVSHFEDRVQ